jgi:hypothetical protein
MSLDGPLKNKQIVTPPAKKGFHFASDGFHFAEFIEAETLAAAEEIFHKIKRKMNGQTVNANSETAPLSTSLTANTDGDIQ